MNSDELQSWKEAVGIHLEHLDALINDRKTLKNSLIEHLKSCFDWDDIEFNKNLSKVELTWEYGHNPIIKHENIGQLGMDWIIRADYDDSANRIVVIEVYPFGIKESVNSP